MAEIDNKDLFTKINVGSGTDLMTMTRWVLAQQQVRCIVFLNICSLYRQLGKLLLIHFLAGFC
jgi:hypothetical protein